MNIGKCKESILKRSVYKQLHKRDDHVLCRPGIGQGAAVVALPEQKQMVTHTECFTGTASEIAALLVHGMAAAVLCKGAIPRYLELSVLLSESDREEELRALMQCMDKDCAAYHMEVIGGHTEVIAGLKQMTVTATVIGFADEVMTIRPKPGDDLIVTGYVGLYGTSILYRRKKQELQGRYYPDFLQEIEAFDDMLSIRKACEVARGFETSCLYGIAKNGIFGALWEVAVAGKTGFKVDLKKIPLRQQTVELCNYFDVNPYMLSGYGAMVIATPDGEHLKKALQAEGIAASIIGRFEDNNDKVILNDDEIRYLDMSVRSELWTYLKED